jgi:hypothetical protein
MSSYDQEMQDRQHPVDEDIALQRRIWKFERVGWYVLLLVVLLTLGGLFSRGQKDLTVEYQRFHRSGGVDAMVIHSHGQPGKPHTIIVDAALLEAFSVDSMQPQPISSAANRQGLKLTLTGDQRGDSSLYLSWRNDGLGLVAGRIAVEGGGEVSLNQFIYP